HHDKKVWLFSASGRRKPFNYLDEKGSLVGFDVDFVQEVCNLAGKKCANVLQEFTECTYTHRNTNFPGRGKNQSYGYFALGFIN
ncbi:ABC-type transporter, periplasmic subunit family 3, partial [Elysia marginata]